MIHSTEDYKVEYSDDRETVEAVFDALVEFYKEHGAFFGETIQQKDSVLIEAPNILSRIAEEIIKFKVTYNEEF